MNKLISTRFCFTIRTFCIVLTIYLSSPSLLFGQSTDQILVLHSYTHEYPWTHSQHEGFIQTLEADRKVQALVSTEYLDTKRRAYDETYASELERHLRLKYAGYKSVSIYVTDDNALLFARDHLSRVFPDTPVFFSGVNDYGMLTSLDSSLFTGVFELKEVTPNIEWLLHMDKKANDLIFVGDGSSTYQSIEREARKVLDSYRLRVTFIAEKSLDHALERLRDQPGKYIFLTTMGGMTDAQGKVLPLREIIKSLTLTGRTVISMEDVYIIEGVLGGYVTSGQKQGINAARLLLAYLHGKSVTDLPPILKSPNTFIFDDRVLEQQGIKLPENLRAQAILLHPRKGIYQKYRTLILGSMISLAGLLFLVVTISFLLMSRKKRELDIAQSKIESANSLFKQIAKQSRTVHWEVNIEGLFTNISDVSEAVIGYRPEDIIGKKHFYDLHPSEGLETKKLMIEAFRRKESFRNIESHLQTRNGQVVWVSSNGIPFLDNIGNFLGYRGSSTDITERKQIEEKLRDGEARLRTVIDRSPFPVALVDRSDERIIYWSQQAINTFGHNPHNVSEWYELAYPDPAYREQVIKSWKPYLEKAYKTKLTVNTGEYRITCKDGTTKICEIYAQFIPGNLIVTLNDITQQKKVEHALKISEARMREAQRIANIGNWSLDLQTGTVEMSDEMLNLIGLKDKNEALSVSNHEKFYTPESWQRFNEAVETAINKGKNYEIELEFSDKNTKYRSALTRGEVIYGENNKVIGLKGTLQDITQSRKAQNEIRRLNIELEKRVHTRTAQLELSNKEMEAFSYSVSHDLRAPLRHICGYVALLNNGFREALPDKAVDYLDTITTSSVKMGTLIDDLLQFSRTGRQDMRKAYMDMNVLVEEALEGLKQDIVNRNICWSVAELPKVFGDSSMLKQVWVNLLDNAVKYTRNKEKADIEVGFTQESDHWVFFVRDNGVGFDMKYAHKLFGVFQRLHSPEDFEGTGIGLANVHRIVHKHAGSVWAEAEPDKGATFYFTIPCESHS